jgi:hypothetical protein
MEEVARMVQAGASSCEIASIYQVSARAVQYRLKKRGLRPRRARAPQEARAIEARRGEIHLLRGRALTVPEMAAYLGLRIGSLRSWMRRHMGALYAQMQTEVRGRRVHKVRPALRKPDRPARPPASRRGPLQGARVRRDYLAGYSMMAIARHYRSHPWAVWRVLRRQGVPARPKTKRSPMWLRAIREHKARREPR